MKLNMMTLKALLPILVLAAFPSQSFSAGGSGANGGGDAIVCNVPLLGQDSTLADLYVGKRSFELDSLDWALPDSIETAILDFVRSKDPVLAGKLSEAHAALTFNYSKKAVQPLDDDGIRLSPLNGIFCQKKQLARQNFESGEVLIDEDLLGHLSMIEQSVLKVLHEPLIRIEREQSAIAGNTSDVRAKVFKIVSQDDFLPFITRSVVGTLSVPLEPYWEMRFYVWAMAKWLHIKGPTFYTMCYIAESTVGQVWSQIESRQTDVGMDGMPEILQKSGLFKCQPVRGIGHGHLDYSYFLKHDLGGNKKLPAFEWAVAYGNAVCSFSPPAVN